MFDFEDIDVFSKFEDQSVWKEEKDEEPVILTSSAKHTGNVVIHRKAETFEIRPLFETLYTATTGSSSGCPSSLTDEVASALLLHIYGKRNIRKDAVNLNQLSDVEQEIFKYIRTQLKHPLRKKRVFQFIQQKEITKRLINYFVVHYSLCERELSYYLDRSSYPYQIIGELNKPNQPEILQRMEAGENIVWINFYQEYKDSKHTMGRKNRHAPYRRSVSVYDDGEEFSLCELHFYLWLDDVGGFELFYRFEDDIRQKKSLHDEHKRKQQLGPGKKKKIVLMQTDGRNFRTNVLRYKRPPAYFVGPKSKKPKTQ